MSGRLGVPDTITPLALPPRSRELNPLETVWQLTPQNRLPNRVLGTHDDIAAHRCEARNKLTNQPRRIRPLGPRNRAHET